MISQWVYIVHVGKKLPSGFHERYEFYTKPEYPHLDLNEYAALWCTLVKIYGYGKDSFRPYKQQIRPYITTILCSFLYLFAGLYKLWFIFF